MLFVLFGFLVGTLLGSLVLCLASRTLTNQTFWGRSYCDNCKVNLKWYDLFPILSYIIFQGKCSHCKKRIDLEYPLIELLMGLLIALLFYMELPAKGITLSTFSAYKPLDYFFIASDLIYKIFIICIFVILFITDIKKYLIPNRITYPAIVIALLYLIFLPFIKIYIYFQSLKGSELGKYLLPPHSNYFYQQALTSFDPFVYGATSAFFAFLFFGFLILITKGRGMGGGDLKLAVFIGLVLGFPGTLIAIMLAFLLGSLVGILLLTIGKKKFGQAIPFGPFLSIGSLAALFWGNQIFNWYLNLRLFN
jgi:leader peptidase (prepilin peptidase) / N-methyltransferase